MRGYALDSYTSVSTLVTPITPSQPFFVTDFEGLPVPGVYPPSSYQARTPWSITSASAHEAPLPTSMKITRDHVRGSDIVHDV